MGPAERCSPSSSFLQLPLHGVQLPGSRLSGKFQQTVSSHPLALVRALEAANTSPIPRNATLLRSGATPAPTTAAGTETTASHRSTSGMAALVCAMCLVTGTPLRILRPGLRQQPLLVGQLLHRQGIWWMPIPYHIRFWQH